MVSENFTKFNDRMLRDFIQRGEIDDLKVENNKEIKHINNKIVLLESSDIELKLLIERLS